jgi:hypothetical protein
VTTITDSLNNSVQYTNTITSINTEITLNLALPSVLRKQCNPSYHTITTYVSYNTTPSFVNFSYLDIDDVWQPLTQVTYVNSSTPVIFTVPSINANNGLTIAVKVGNCYSESQFITLGDVEKPITTLAGNISKSGPSSGVYTYVVTSSGGIGGFGVGTLYKYFSNIYSYTN